MLGPAATLTATTEPPTCSSPLAYSSPPASYLPVRKKREKEREREREEGGGTSYATKGIFLKKDNLNNVFMLKMNQILL